MALNMAVERRGELVSDTFGLIELPGVVADMTKARCKVHGDWYFRRVKGDRFQCTHVDHEGGTGGLIVDPLPDGDHHLQR